MVLSGECCSSHLGTELSLAHLLRQDIYCSSGTNTELLLLPGSRDWFVLPMTLLVLPTSVPQPAFSVCNFFACLPSLSLSLQKFFVFCIWFCSFIFLCYAVFFLSFFTFYRSKDYWPAMEYLKVPLLSFL